MCRESSDIPRMSNQNGLATAPETHGSIGPLEIDISIIITTEDRGIPQKWTDIFGSGRRIMCIIYTLHITILYWAESHLNLKACQ